jgi:hypothetical protein
MSIGVPGLVFLGAGIGRGRHRSSGKLLTLCVIGSLLMMLCLLVGCGGGGNTTTPPPHVTNNGTPAGSYTVSITGTSGTFQTTVPVTLKVM